ncbi:MAG: TonB-dependent receptor [Bacteroidota bacterium]|nr:TonB-dependent receptor [Bacteroidota bacterium]
MKRRNFITRNGISKHFFLLIFISLSVVAPAFAQQVYTGFVRDQKGNPLVGATISVKNKLVTATASNGQFSVKGAEGDMLTVTFVGYQAYNIKLGGTHSLTIVLSPSVSQMEDVVVVGYGTVKKKDLTGSVAVVNVADAQKNPTHDAAKMLQGQVAGVTVQGSGEPGGYVSIKIRGVTSFDPNGNNANSPLFVVDGVIVDAPFDFSTDDIESIQVLKDASATAIYGTRGAPGVIIITTKKGKAGAPRVTLNSYYGIQNVPKKIAVLDRVGYQKVVNAADVNAGLALAPANDPTSPNYVSNINTDWQHEALKTGIIQDHNIGVSGGSESLFYNLALGYFNQTGYQVGPQAYNRYTINTSLQGKKGKLSYGARVAYTYSKKGNYAGTANHAVFGGTVTSMLTAIPTLGVYDSSRLGGYAGSDQTINRAISANVVGLNKLIDDWSERNRILLNGWAELEIIKNLKYRINASFDRTDYKNYHYEPKFDMGFYYVNSQYYYHEDFGAPNTQLIENTLAYSFKKRKHQVDLLAGYTFQKSNINWVSGSSRSSADFNYQTFSNAAASANTITEYRGLNTITGRLARLNYNYDNRYLFTANFRRDGSSKFAPSNTYGNFVGFAGAWNVHNEKFIHLPSQISSLKLRGGWGSVGNENPLGQYQWQSYINNAANYNFANTLAPGSITVSLTDPNVHWETTTTTNVAIDLGMFNEKLTLTAEYYNKTPKDLLVNQPLPYSAGSMPASIITNVGSMRNTGLEFTLGYKKVNGKFTYNVNANFSTLTNKVLQLGVGNNPIYGAGSKTQVGHSVGELYGYQTEGLFQTAAQIANHAYQSALTSPGDVMFKAQNAANENNHVYQLTDANDRTFLGTTIPKYYYGLNFDAKYQQFDFSVFFQGSAGNKVFNGVYQALMSGQDGNQHVDELNFWSSTNTNTNVPRPIMGDPNGNGRFSDRFVQDGSYVKLQNMQIGYSLPESVSLIKKHILSKLRIYVSGENLITFSKYKGYDPDFISDGLFSRGFDYGSFPNARTFMFGIQAGF